MMTGAVAGPYGAGGDSSEGAALVGSMREELTGLTVWPLEPIPPGTSKRIVVELDATGRETRGTFTLKLWGGQDGAEGLALDGVTFP